MLIIIIRKAKMFDLHMYCESPIYEQAREPFQRSVTKQKQENKSYTL